MINFILDFSPVLQSNAPESKAKTRYILKTESFAMVKAGVKAVSLGIPAVRQQHSSAPSDQ